MRRKRKHKRKHKKKRTIVVLVLELIPARMVDGIRIIVFALVLVILLASLEKTRL